MVRYSAKTWDCSVKHRQCPLLFRNPSLIKGTRSMWALATRCVSCIKIAFATWAWTGTLMLERRGRDERGWGGCILFFADSCIDCALSNSLAYCDFALKCGTSSLAILPHFVNTRGSLYVCKSNLVYILPLIVSAVNNLSSSQPSLTHSQKVRMYGFVAF